MDKGLTFHQVAISDEQGKVITDITSVSIYLPGTTTLATIYKTHDLDFEMTQPLTTSSSNTTLANGIFEWWGPDGWDFSVTDGSTIVSSSASDTRTASTGQIVFDSGTPARVAALVVDLLTAIELIIQSDVGEDLINKFDLNARSESDTAFGQYLMRYTNAAGTQNNAAAVRWRTTDGSNGILELFAATSGTNALADRIRIEGTAVRDQLTLGNGDRQGALAVDAGSGGSAPAFAKLQSPNGTDWYLFIEDDGTVKVSSSEPTQNSDGDVIGAQT